MRTILCFVIITFVLTGLVVSGKAIVLNPIEHKNYTAMSQSPIKIFEEVSTSYANESKSVKLPNWIKNTLGIEEYGIRSLDFSGLKEVQKPIIVPLNKEDGNSYIIIDDVRVAPYLKEVEIKTAEGILYTFELTYKELIYYRDKNNWIATMDTDTFQEVWNGTILIPAEKRKLTPWLDVGSDLSYNEVKTILNSNLGSIYVYLANKNDEIELFEAKVLRISTGLEGEEVTCKDPTGKTYTFSPSEFNELRDGFIYIFAENMNIYEMAYNNANIEDVFYHLVRETGINYIFSEDDFCKISKEEGDLTDASLDEALRYLLKNTNLKHYIKRNILSLIEEVN